MHHFETFTKEIQSTNYLYGECIIKVGSATISKVGFGGGMCFDKGMTRLYREERDGAQVN